MNNVNNYYFPCDSLGRRIGVANGFENYTDAMLDVMRQDLGLSMDISAMRFIRDHYKRSGNKKLLLEEIYLLDEIVKASGSFTESSLIYDFYTDNPEIAEVYGDMIAKYKATSTSTAPALTLEKAANVASLYTKSIGIMPSSCLQTQVSKAPKLSDNIAFLYVYPNESNKDYDTSVNEFLNCEGYKQTALLSKLIDTRGIAYALSTCAQGIYADLHSLPSIVGTPELSSLATEGHGKYIVATYKERIFALSAIAKEYDLECVYFARVYPSATLTLRKVGRTEMTLDTSLILALGSGQRREAYRVTDDIYRTSAEAYVDSVLPWIACGSSLQDITVSSCYQFPSKTESDIKRGECLSSILGAYRSQIELCTAGGEQKLRFNNGNTALVNFMANGIPKHINDVSKMNSMCNLYFYSYNHKENGSIDYASLRAMCKVVLSLINEGKAEYSIAVTKSLKDSFACISPLFNLAARNELPISVSDKASGILIATQAQLSDGLFVGIISPRVIEEEQI